MEIRTKKTSDKAAAYLKMGIKDKNGNVHHFKMDTFLYDNRELDKMLIADPKILDNLKRDQIVLSLNVPKEAVTPEF